MRILTYILLIIIVLIGVAFASLNPNAVTINYFIAKKTMPLSLLLVTVFALGCLLGLLVGLCLLLKLEVKNYQLNHRLKMAEKEIQNLRVIPLQDRH